MCMSFRTYRRDVSPFEAYTKGRLFGLDVSINWPSNRHWQIKKLDSWKATQLNLLRQKSVNSTSRTKPWLSVVSFSCGSYVFNSTNRFCHKQFNDTRHEARAADAVELTSATKRQVHDVGAASGCPVFRLRVAMVTGPRCSTSRRLFLVSMKNV